MSLQTQENPEFTQEAQGWNLMALGSQKLALRETMCWRVSSSNGLPGLALQT